MLLAGAGDGDRPLAFQKAQYVIRTSVALSRQGDADEVFGSNPMARDRPRIPFHCGNHVEDSAGTPEALVNSRFDDTKLELEADDAAFDLIRASVNLVLASLLIALEPLSNCLFRRLT